MIIIYVIFFALSVALFFLTSKQTMAVRIALAIGVFAGLSILVTLWVYKIGDKPLPGAVTVSPNDVNPSKTVVDK